MLISIVKANYIKDYQLEIFFDNGISSIIDLRETIFNDHRKIFEVLQDKNLFKNFSLDSWTIEWKNELALAPEYLYELAIKQEKKATVNIV